MYSINARSQRHGPSRLYLSWQLWQHRSDHSSIPIDIQRKTFLPDLSGKKVLIIAVANFIYLATIGYFIKARAATAGYECQIIEKPQDEIHALLDTAVKERIINA